jgi:hypothetical protein
MAVHIRRREFIVALSSAPFGRQLAARAQQLSLPKIGVLCSKSLQFEKEEWQCRGDTVTA